MKKEELEKEAEEYVSKYQGWGWSPHEGSAVFEAMVSSYIDSAEPREKRIAELEEENAELKKECRRCVHTDCPCILSDYGKDRNGICDHFKDVFDENTELKEAKKQFMQAKDLITRFVMASVYLNGKEADLVEQAEQFLKE